MHKHTFNKSSNVTDTLKWCHAVAEYRRSNSLLILSVSKACTVICFEIHAHVTHSSVLNTVAFSAVGKLQEMDLLCCNYDEAEQEEAGLLHKPLHCHVIRLQLFSGNML